MGLFDFIFKNRPEPKGEYKGEFKLLNGYEPKFHRFGGDIYESELVRSAINAIATHISKLKVEVYGTAKPALQSKLQHGPNALETWSQFLYRLATILYVHNTAFVVPVFDTLGAVSGVFAVLPDQCEIVQYGENKTPYLRYKFGWGETAAVEWDSCGVLTRYHYKHDLFGETNHALLPTMDLIDIQNQGIEEGVKSAASYRFMATLTNFAKPEDLAKERKRFTEENFAKDGGGMLLFPNTYGNVKQVETKPFVADAETMKAIRASVYEYFGVNEDVLTNKAYGDAWSAFYEGVIEPFAIQFSEVMTRMLFTLNEQSRGSFVMATANRLQYLSSKDKLEVSAQMLDRGIMSLNDVRDIWNLPHIDGGDVHIVRGEYYNATERLGGDTNENDAEEN